MAVLRPGVMGGAWDGNGGVGGQNGVDVDGGVWSESVVDGGAALLLALLPQLALLFQLSPLSLRSDQPCLPWVGGAVG